MCILASTLLCADTLASFSHFPESSICFHISWIPCKGRLSNQARLKSEVKGAVPSVPSTCTGVVQWCRAGGGDGTYSYKSSRGVGGAVHTHIPHTLAHPLTILRFIRQKAAKFGIQVTEVGKNCFLVDACTELQELDIILYCPERVGLRGGVRKDALGFINGFSSRTAPSLDGRFLDSCRERIDLRKLQELRTGLKRCTWSTTAATTAATTATTSATLPPGAKERRRINLKSKLRKSRAAKNGARIKYNILELAALWL